MFKLPHSHTHTLAIIAKGKLLFSSKSCVGNEHTNSEGKWFKQFSEENHIYKRK